MNQIDDSDPELTRAQQEALSAYEAAKADHQDWQDRFDRYDGNNPDKFRSDVRSALERLAEAERAAKRSGALKMTSTEALNERLDKAFPNAASRSIHHLDGQRYQRLYLPLTWSNSGKTVREYTGSWKLVGSVDKS